MVQGGGSVRPFFHQLAQTAGRFASCFSLVDGYHVLTGVRHGEKEEAVGWMTSNLLLDYRC